MPDWISAVVSALLLHGDFSTPGRQSRLRTLQRKSGDSECCDLRARTWHGDFFYFGPTGQPNFDARPYSSISVPAADWTADERAGLIEARANVLCQWFCTSVALIPTNGCPKRELQKAPDLTVGKVLQEIQHVSYSSAHSNSRLQTHMHASVHWQRRELFVTGSKVATSGCHRYDSSVSISRRGHR